MLREICTYLFLGSLAPCFEWTHNTWKCYTSWRLDASPSTVEGRRRERSI